MKNLFLTLAMMTFLGSCSKQVNPNVNLVNPNTNPVNPNANHFTKKVYDYLWGLSYGSTPGVIVGQNCEHGNEIVVKNSYQNFVQNLANSSGKYVGMIGVDYEFIKIYSISELKQANTKPIEFWNEGGLITVNYSPSNILANNTGPMTRGGGGTMYRILPGGDLRSAWLARLDVIASALQDLQNNGVTVLWRPMQESNGSLFWYATNYLTSGGQSAADFISLYRDMYNYFTNTKGLNNLLWVFAPTGDNAWSPYPYPGSAYVDIVARTRYNTPLYINQNDYITYNKIMGVSEYGWDTDNSSAQHAMALIQTTATDNPKLAYFVCWHDWTGVKEAIISQRNSSTMMNDPQSITRDKIPNLNQ